MIFNSYNTAAEEIFLINYTEVIRPTSHTLKIPIGYNNITADTWVPRFMFFKFWFHQWKKKIFSNLIPKFAISKSLFVEEEGKKSHTITDIFTCCTCERYVIEIGSADDLLQIQPQSQFFSIQLSEQYWVAPIFTTLKITEIIGLRGGVRPSYGHNGD